MIHGRVFESSTLTVELRLYHFSVWLMMTGTNGNPPSNNRGMAGKTVESPISRLELEPSEFRLKLSPMLKDLPE